jgi:hypothetical protein
MSVSTQGGFQEEWRAFMMEPVNYMEGGRLADCFGSGLSVELCERLRLAPRLQERLSTVVRDFYGLEWVDPGDCEEIDRLIALYSAEYLADLAFYSGAIFWSGAIANTVVAQDVETLEKELGDELCAFALNHRDVAGPLRTLGSPEGVRERVLEDGWRCLAAWRQQQPEGVAVRIALRLPPNPAFDGAPPHPFDAFGPSIVRRAASATHQGAAEDAA